MFEEISKGQAMDQMVKRSKDIYYFDPKTETMKLAADMPLILMFASDEYIYLKRVNS